MATEKNSPRIITVTDHAIVRYFERIEGRDIDRIRREINNPELLEWVATLGDGNAPVDCPVNNRYYARIVNHTAVTILNIK